MHRVSLDNGSHLMHVSRFNKANLELYDDSSSHFRAKPHKLSALRLNRWPCAERDFICDSSKHFITVQVTSNRQHAVQGLQVAKRAGAPSDSSTEPDRWKAKDGILQMIHYLFLFPVQMASLDNFIETRQSQVSFVIENLKPNSQTHILLSGSGMGLVTLLMFLNIESAFQ